MDNLLLQCKQMLKFSLQIIGLICSVFFVPACSAQSESFNVDEIKLVSKCDDFLRNLSHPPESIKYIECHKDEDNYLKPLVAKYQFEGKHAVDVEQFLISTFSLSSLEYNCCGWESAKGVTSFIDKKTGIYYLIGVGVETIYSDKKDWDKIPYFTLTISSDTEGV